jgi:hypothetical protein
MSSENFKIVSNLKTKDSGLNTSKSGLVAQVVRALH